jgi:anhydro-N-acetylmuramic acid kinase
MSGTSLDGVDAAWLETDGVHVTALGPSLTVPYDPKLRSDLRVILDLAPTLHPDDPRLISAVERLTDYHVQAVRALSRSADIIGFHGQTILHQPNRGRTWQVGDAAALARKIGVPVVFDFRSADIAAGGQGAPLAPIYHAALADRLPKPVTVLNIGGVANVTWIGAGGELIAFDTGPGNGPLDDWSARHTGQAFDRDGLLARSGRIDQGVLHALLSHPFFRLSAPKSLDRLDFTRALEASGANALAVADGAATLAAFTVEAIVMAAFPEPPRRWLVCGGGRYNPVIMDGLAYRLGVPVQPVETVGWDGDALEAQCFGFLAARVCRGLALSFPSTTGVSSPTTGGQITFGH